MNKLRTIDFRAAMVFTAIIAILGLNVSYLLSFEFVADAIYYSHHYSYQLGGHSELEFVLHTVSKIGVLYFTLQLAGSIIGIVKNEK